MTLMEDWIAAHNFEPDQVKRIEVQTNERIYNTLLHHRPRTGLQSKFSLPFALAIIVLRRKAGFAEFTDAVASDRVVQAMIERINYTPYTELAPDYTNVTTLLRVTLNDGREYSGRVDFGKGHPKRRMDYHALAHKFHDCATHARWPEGKAKSVVEMIRQVEDIPDVRELTRLLVL